MIIYWPLYLTSCKCVTVSSRWLYIWIRCTDQHLYLCCKCLQKKYTNYMPNGFHCLMALNQCLSVVTMLLKFTEVLIVYNWYLYSNIVFFISSLKLLVNFEEQLLCGALVSVKPAWWSSEVANWPYISRQSSKIHTSPFM